MPLMLIHDSDGLHEGMANGRSDESEALLLQVPAHRIALSGGHCDIAETKRPAPQGLAARELPDVVAEGIAGGEDLKVCACVADERVHFETIADDARILQQAAAFRGIVAG